ncbi:hypothetical protein [Thiolapillus sp.]
MLKMQRASQTVPPMVLISMPRNHGSFMMFVCSGPEQEGKATTVSKID